MPLIHLYRPLPPLAYYTMAEMVAAMSGLGWMVLDASKFLQSDVIFVGIITMGITGVLLDLCFLGLERLIVPWKGK